LTVLVHFYLRKLLIDATKAAGKRLQLCSLDLSEIFCPITGHLYKWSCVSMFKLLILLVFLSLTSCAINTNLGPYAKNKVEGAIRSSVVEVYSRNEIWQLETITLGQVETEYCQTNRLSNTPSERELNKILRSKTQRLGGNGIVYDSCESGRNYRNCEIYIRCQAMAYKVQY